MKILISLLSIVFLLGNVCLANEDYVTKDYFKKYVQYQDEKIRFSQPFGYTLFEANKPLEGSLFFLGEMGAAYAFYVSSSYIDSTNNSTSVNAGYAATSLLGLGVLTGLLIWENNYNKTVMKEYNQKLLQEKGLTFLIKPQALGLSYKF